MVAQHVLEPEMLKGLDFLCSYYTARPCYWSGVKFDEESKSWNDKKDKVELYRYNCLDTVVTFEAYEKMREELKSHPSSGIFDYEMEMLEVAMHISSAGFNVNVERKDFLYKIIKSRRDNDYAFLTALAGKFVLVSSPKQVKEFLYDKIGLPARHNRDGGITTDSDALIGLIGFCKGEISKLKTEEAKAKWHHRIAILKLLLNIRGYDKLLSSYIGATYSADGRMRGQYKVTGTESGRWAGGNWLDDTGLNMQTLPRESVEV
jgi:DNA polymerase I-like protein with 3'-5' exonuclease and polymerase domains